MGEIGAGQLGVVGAMNEDEVHTAHTKIQGYQGQRHHFVLGKEAF